LAEKAIGIDFLSSYPPLLFLTPFFTIVKVRQNIGGFFMSQSPSPIKAGIFYILTAMFIFSCTNALVKDVAQTYPMWEVVFFRLFFVIIPASYMIYREGGVSLLKAHQWGKLVFLGVLGAFGVYFLFMAFRYLPLADATGLAYSSILFITALSGPLLKEAVGIHRWLAVLLGFVGVLIMASPQGNLDPNTLYAIGFAMIDGLLMIVIRLLTRQDRSSVIVFYFAVFASVISGAFMLFDWQTPTLKDFFILVAMGIGGGVGQLFMTNAYKLAPAVVVAPMSYSSMLWGALFGFVFFQEIPTWQVGVGAATVIAAGLYIIYRETMIPVRLESAG
jgi:drug/metabolite transporter (DMT)-like permease